MANNFNRGSNYHQDRNSGGRKGKYEQQDQNPYHKVNTPLSQEYSDVAALYLPDGIAYQLAENFKKIPSHQLRKVLSQAKLAVQEIDVSSDNLKKAQLKLFELLPMAAYNAGRNKDLYILWYFLEATISQKSIVSVEDILLFDKLFTSVIAYHKFKNPKS